MVEPGQVAANSTIPFGAQTLDQASWAAGIALDFKDAIVDQAFQLGDPSKVGLPASWPYGPLSKTAVKADGSVSALLMSQIQQYVNSPAAMNDADFAAAFGAPVGSSLAAGGYIDKPLTVAEQTALRAADREDAKFLLSLSGGGGSGARVATSSSGGARTSYSGGGSSGGTGDDYGGRLAYESASDAQNLAAKQAELEIRLAFEREMAALQADPNNPDNQYRIAQLTEQKRQFDEQMAYNRARDEKSLGLDKTKMFTDYVAGGGNDAVAREIFLRTGQQPTGNVVNTETGQQTGQSMTLSELMSQQANQINPALPATPPEDPQFARGTARTLPMQASQMAQSRAFGQQGMAKRADPELTRDGWTRADRFIAGDPQMPGVVNPEKIQLRVRNGQPEAKVTPISQLMARHPRFATGTNPYSSTNSSYSQDEIDQVQAFNAREAAMTEARQAGNPYIAEAIEDNPNIISLADLNWNDLFAGNNSTVTNGNSLYEGMGLEDAARAMQARAFAPKVVAPKTGVVSIDNPAGTGGLTAGQLAAGVTQSVAPWMPGYKPPVGFPGAPSQFGQDIATDMKDPAQEGGPGGPNLAEEPTAAQAAPVPAGSVLPGSTVAVGTPNEGGYQQVMVPGTFKHQGATYTLRAGDWRAPDGTFMRYNESLGTHVPIMPQGSLITSEAQFRALSPEDQQAILSGKQTGYRLDESGPIQWLTNLHGSAGKTTLTPEQFQAQDLQSRMNALSKGEIEVGSASYQPGSETAYNGPGPNWGMPTGLSSLAPREFYGQMADPWELMTDAQRDEINNMTPTPPPPMPTGSMNMPWDNLTTPTQEPLPTGWVAYHKGLGNEIVVDPRGRVFRRENGIWFKGETIGQTNGAGTPLTPDMFISQLAEQGFKTGLYIPPAPVTGTGGSKASDPQFAFGTTSTYIDPPPPPSSIATTQPATESTPYIPPPLPPAPSGTTGITAPPPVDVPPPAPVTTPPPSLPTPPSAQSPAPSLPPSAGSPPPPPVTLPVDPVEPMPTTDTPAPPASGSNTPLSQLLALLGLSYGPDVYQNLDILKLLGGGMSQGSMDTITDEDIYVPGMGVTVPSPNKAANYANLSYLQQNNPSAFELLNSLYTAGNVPLSAIMAFAKSRAPLGSAYESSLVQTN